MATIARLSTSSRRIWLRRHVRAILCVFTRKQHEIGAMKDNELHIIHKGIRPVVVVPSQACVLLSIGMTRCYELMNCGALESFKDGKSRKITVRSIEAYVQSRLQGTNGGVEGRGVRMQPGRPEKDLAQGRGDFRS